MFPVKLPMSAALWRYGSIDIKGSQTYLKKLGFFLHEHQCQNFLEVLKMTRNCFKRSNDES